MSRTLTLLSPYRLPTQSTLYLGDEEVAAFLNGWAALWHPLALHGAGEAPRLASPYDHEQPQPGHVYALPADRLLAAREVVYPVTVHVVDLCLPDPEKLDAPWPAALERGLPCNLVACSALLERLAAEQPRRLAELRERAAGELAEVCGGPYL